MKDQIIKFLAYDGKISVTCIATTNLVEKARIIHDLSPLTTAAQGRVLTITALIGADMKNATDKLTIQIKGNGPIGKIVAVADSTPKVKACITDPHVELPLNEFRKIDVGGAVGNEIYMIKRTLYRNKPIDFWRNSRRLCKLFSNIRTKTNSSCIRSIS